jgi:hypothetical protein
MRMRRTVVTGLVAAVLWLTLTGATASAVVANHVHNPGFEKPVVGAGSFQVFSTGQTFPNWRVVGAPGSVGIVSGTFTQGGFTFSAKAGKQWLDLTGLSQTATGVSQTVVTTIGTSYALSFAVGNVVNPGGIFGTPSTVGVRVNGAQILAATNSNGAGTMKTNWKTFKVNFTATSTTTTIAFINLDPPTDSQNGLDAVTLVAL